ncbi:MAG: hypothetical protein AVDCRST_MAG36-376, partial [uncultured Nocardioidaceae bacterium]
GGRDRTARARRVPRRGVPVHRLLHRAGRDGRSAPAGPGVRRGRRQCPPPRHGSRLRRHPLRARPSRPPGQQECTRVAAGPPPGARPRPRPVARQPAAGHV